MTAPAPAFHAAATVHAGVLAALHAPCFGSEAWDAGAFVRLLSATGVAGLIADTGAAGLPQPAGFVLFRTVADEAEILTIAVLPEYRGQGIGRRLVERASDLAASAGACSLFLEVAEDNRAARALYRAAGFVIAGHRRGYYRRAGGAVDALVLRRPLAPP